MRSSNSVKRGISELRIKYLGENCEQAKRSPFTTVIDNVCPERPKRPSDVCNSKNTYCQRQANINVSGGSISMPSSISMSMSI